MESTPSRHPVSHPLTPSKGVLSCSLLITISKWHWLCLPSKSLLYPIPSPGVVISGGGGGILPHLMMAISITTMCIHQKCCSSTLRLVGLCYTVNVLLLLFLVLTEQYWKMNSGDEAEKTPPPHPSTSFKAQSLLAGRDLVGGWWWMEWKFWLKMVINKISNRVFSGGGVNLLIVSSFHFIYQSKSNLWQFIATKWKMLDGETGRRRISVECDGSWKMEFRECPSLCRVSLSRDRWWARDGWLDRWNRWMTGDCHGEKEWTLLTINCNHNCFQFVKSSE